MRAWMLCLLAACGGGSDPESTGDTTPPEPAPDYSERGAYTPGTEDFEVPGPEGLTLTAQVWFPSEDTGSNTVVYDNLLPGEAYEGLSPACDSPRPVVVFSHGLGGVRWQSAFFTEHLATHGFIVVAVDHIGSGLTDTNPAQLGQVAMRRPLDVAAAFDGLADAYPDCVDPAAGYAVSGHSFGGYTAFAAGGAELNDPTNGGASTHAGDDRVWAVIALAPWDAGGVITDGNADIVVPSMVLTGDEDRTTPLAMVRGLWQGLVVEPRRFGIIANAGHYSFSPVACLLETGDGCGPDFVSEDELNPLINQAATAFLSAELGVFEADLQIEANNEIFTWQGQGDF